MAEHSPQTVVIHIDKKEYKSPNPTTGHALYDLDKVDPNVYDLYREVPGKGDDEFIPNSSQQVVLRDGDHFFSVQKKLNPGGKCADPEE